MGHGGSRLTERQLHGVPAMSPAWNYDYDYGSVPAPRPVRLTGGDSGLTGLTYMTAAQVKAGGPAHSADVRAGDPPAVLLSEVDKHAVWARGEVDGYSVGRATSTTPTRGRKSTPNGGTAATVGRYTPPAWDSRPRSRRARPRIRRRAETDADRTEIASLRLGRGPRRSRGNDNSRRRQHPDASTAARSAAASPGGNVALWRRPRRHAEEPGRPVPVRSRAATDLGRRLGVRSHRDRPAGTPVARRGHRPGNCVPYRDAHRRRRSPSRPAQEVNRDHHQRTSRRGHFRRAHGAGNSDDAPDVSATDQPAAATEPADEDQALPVEANLAGETAAALTQACSIDAEPGDASVVAEAAGPVPATEGGPTAATTLATTRPVSSPPPTSPPGTCVAAVVGDGEAESGPLAGAWRGTAFLNPARDGAVHRRRPPRATGAPFAPDARLDGQRPGAGVGGCVFGDHCLPQSFLGGS